MTQTRAHELRRTIREQVNAEHASAEQVMAPAVRKAVASSLRRLAAIERAEKREAARRGERA